jgi:hypothetical protein
VKVEGEAADCAGAVADQATCEAVETAADDDGDAKACDWGPAVGATKVVTEVDCLDAGGVFTRGLPTVCEYEDDRNYGYPERRTDTEYTYAQLGMEEPTPPAEEGRRQLEAAESQPAARSRLKPSLRSRVKDSNL